jgi:streptogramin lyase
MATSTSRGFRTDQVRRLSPTGAALDIPVPAGAAGLDGPDNGIAFAPDGNLYVPGYNSSNVIRHDPRTGRRRRSSHATRKG